MIARDLIDSFNGNRAHARASSSSFFVLLREQMTDGFTEGVLSLRERGIIDRH